MNRIGSRAGQASLEVLAFMPALLLIGLVCFQLLAVGYAAVLADHAAESAALAAANGQDPEQAARDAVPGWSHVGLVAHSDAGEVTVKVRPFSPFDFLAKKLQVGATASVATAAGG